MPSRRYGDTGHYHSASRWASLKRMLIIAHLMVVGFLWDGSLDTICGTNARLMRGGEESLSNSADHIVAPEHASEDVQNQAAGGVGGHGVDSKTPLTSISNRDEKPVLHSAATVHNSPDKDVVSKHVVHKDAHPGRSADASARHAEMLHASENKQNSGSSDFHQSYSAGPPPSEFWSVLNGVETKMSDLRPSPYTDLSTRPLISLVMIVHNEAQSIAGTIESVLGIVDRYTILDTGSTDNTVELIKKTFGSTPGDIFQEPFVDFATTRNRVIELEGTKSVFALMLSGDEYLRDGQSLRAFCEKHRDWDTWITRGAKQEAYNLRILYGHDVYDSTRLHRTDARWFYVGVTHEYMTNARKRVATIRVVDDAGGIPKIYHDLSTSDPKKKAHRWSMDRDLLIEEWKRNPNRTRTAFYLAQSYECLGDWNKAFKWYQTRWNLKGWMEEAYEARFRMARVSRHLETPSGDKIYSWPETQQMYLDAHAYLPKRVEPLYSIGHYYYHEVYPRNYELAFIFLHRASMIPFPTDLRLFLDKTVYDYKVPDLLGIVSYYTKENEIGRRHVLKALSQRPKDARLLKNLKFFNLRMGREETDTSV